eukprot:708192-Amphidinium_carterae.1
MAGCPFGGVRAGAKHRQRGGWHTATAPSSPVPCASREIKLVRVGALGWRAAIVPRSKWRLLSAS